MRARAGKEKNEIMKEREVLQAERGVVMTRNDTIL